MIIDYISAGLIVVLCLLCIYTDIKSGIIKNSILFFLGMPVVIINIVRVILNYKNNQTEYLLSVFISGVICIVLYWLKIWAGGDCKLNLILCFALPYKYAMYNFWVVRGVVLSVLLPFAIGYLYILAESLIYSIRDKKMIRISKGDIKSQFLAYISYYLVLTFVNGMVGILISTLNIKFTDWILLIDLLIIFAIRKIRMIDYKFVPIVFLCVDLILNLFEIINILNIKTIILWSMVVLMYLCRQFVSVFSYESTRYTDIKEGMILSLFSSVELSRNKKVDFARVSDETMQSRLTKTEASKISEWAITNNVEAEALIVRKIPFAVFIALSEILIIIMVEVLV